uniref:Uncharacterized protein n=2 Tax=Escherichia coli TaxID=562 RepID=A0A890DFH2_ECOLX|nr:hypothetical protein J444_pB58 [Escherichia coli ACN001]QRG43133.1 hypothetical protein [Escherichia coli]
MSIAGEKNKSLKCPLLNNMYTMKCIILIFMWLWERERVTFFPVNLKVE